MEIKKLVEMQRRFYNLGKTRDVAFRKAALRRFDTAIRAYQEELEEALLLDLNKSSFESYMTELGMTYSELSYVRKNFEKWDKKRVRHTPIGQFHAKSFEVKEPYGVALIMSPWNYPCLLGLEPLIGAIAAGNCCILKPSAYAYNVSKVMKKMIQTFFPKEYIAVVEGGREENASLLEQHFDYIFFTGSVSVGKLVMEKAAKNLTPVTLELGGKSPCIIDHTANIKLAAKRIVFGKFLNSGQTCVAPDYVLIEEAVEEEFLEYCKKWIRKMFSENPLKNNDYPKIINQKHFHRVLTLMQDEEVVVGGDYDLERLKIAPTILRNVLNDAPIMQEEIFGPILPVLTVQSIEEAEQMVLQREKPLALYLFTNDKEVEHRILKNLSFGGGCINDTIIHLATSQMGFGGVGSSGMGSYHGRYSYETFSHTKSIVKKYNWIDLPIRYQPYNKGKKILLKMFMK